MIYILCSAWCIIGAIGFVLAWTEEFDFEVHDILLMLFACGLGLLWWLVFLGMRWGKPIIKARHRVYHFNTAEVSQAIWAILWGKK